VRRLVPALCLLLTAAPVAAQPEQPAAAATATPQQQAARSFDAGVAAFQRADYPAAARAFLQADDLAPSAEALTNAIAAARRANDHLLVVQASKRAIAREPEASELAASAREALVQAERHVSRLELACKTAAPCSLTLDEAAVEAGTHHVLPGLHAVVASTADGQRAERRFETAPGSTYQLALEPIAEKRPEAPRPPPRQAAPNVERSSKPLPPVAFWVGVGVTGALAGVTVWSGLDVVKQRDDLPANPSLQQADEDADRIRRTDVLLLASVVVAAVTTYAGVALVDWDSGRASAARPLGFSF
jgi:hypothetical protein